MGGRGRQQHRQQRNEQRAAAAEAGSSEQASKQCLAGGAKMRLLWRPGCWLAAGWLRVLLT